MGRRYGGVLGVLSLLGLAASACATEPEAEHVARTRQAILGGTSSDASQNAVVMLVLVDPATNGRIGICTAALIAPRLVLTARHCVARTNGENVACKADGSPLLGGEIRENYAPDSFYVFTGTDRPAFIGDAPTTVDKTQWKPAGQGAEIIDDRATNLCDHDLALLVLKEPIAAAPLASLRLDAEAKGGENLLTIGWGVTSGEVEPKQRQQRTGVTVKRVGPSESFPVLTRSEFLFDESICLGDSGGPIFAGRTNAIVGVVSRGGNGSDPNRGGPASTCGAADNIGTKLAPFRALVLDAFHRVGAEPRVEPPEDDDGCGVAPTPPELGSAVPLLLAATWIARRRRRACRAGAGRATVERWQDR